MSTSLTAATPATAPRAPGQNARRRMVAGQELPHPLARAGKGLVLVVLCGLVLLPFVGVVSTSISSPDHVLRNGGFVMVPDGFHLDAYRTVLSGGVVTRATVVSLLVTGVGTTLSLAATALLGYALSRRGAFGMRFALLLVLGSLLFAPGMIPVYLTVRSLGLIDSYWALIVPSMVSAFNVVVVRAFFAGIPAELYESARLDGASEWQVFSRIALPLSKAVLAVVGLFYAVGYWNAFFNGLLYLNDAAKWPLQLVLRTYVQQGTALSSADVAAASEALPPQQSLQMAILVISLVPILCVYPFVQRHFTKGVLTGAVKG